MSNFPAHLDKVIMSYRVEIAAEDESRKCWMKRQTKGVSVIHSWECC